MTTYTVTRQPHGVAITGPIPVTDLSALTGVYADRGLVWLDALIAQEIGATAVFVSDEGMKKWRDELGISQGEDDDRSTGR